MTVVGAAAAVTGCATSGLLIDAELARTNTHTVLAFEETVFNKHRVRDGFDRYVGAQFRQHSAMLPGVLASHSQKLSTDKNLHLRRRDCALLITLTWGL